MRAGGSLGETAYRGAQIYHALYAEQQFNIAAMTNLPAALREAGARSSDRPAGNCAPVSFDGWNSPVRAGAGRG